MMTQTDFAQMFLNKNMDVWLKTFMEREAQVEVVPDELFNIALPPELARDPKPFLEAVLKLRMYAALYGGITAIELVSDFWLDFFRTKDKERQVEIDNLRRQVTHLKRLVMEAHLGKLRDYDPDRDSIPQSPESSLPSAEDEEE